MLGAINTISLGNGLVKASDYACADNWFKCPGECEHEVDTFFLYPNVYHPEDKESTPLICEIDDEGMRREVPRQYEGKASLFAASCNVFMPFYRQVDVARLGDVDEAELVAHLAWEPRADVWAALDYYFTHCNNGRPFILAGHSQGSLLLRLVVEEYMQQHRDYYQRMVAAYLPGCSVTYEFLVQNPHLKFARGADDVGTIVSWNVEGPDNAGSSALVITEGAVSINPLNWKRDETPAGVEENLGSALCDDAGQLQLVPGLADARVQRSRGVVVCSSVPVSEYAADYTTVLGNASFHSWDYGFYYVNLQENVKTRIAAFQALHKC